jgi:hypothetical protein
LSFRRSLQFLALATAVALAPFAVSCGKPGWPEFKSAEAGFSGPVPAFSVRYPPWFDFAGIAAGGGGDPQRGPEFPFRVDIGTRADKITGGVIYLYVIVDRFGDEEKRALAAAGPGPYWRAVGGGLAQASGGRYRGARGIVQGGHKGADVWYTADAYPSGARRTAAYLFFRRYLASGDFLVSAVCAIPDPFLDSRRDNFSLLDFPAANGACAPFMDSLKFSE